MNKIGIRAQVEIQGMHPLMLTAHLKATSLPRGHLCPLRLQRRRTSTSCNARTRSGCHLPPHLLPVSFRKDIGMPSGIDFVGAEAHIRKQGCFLPDDTPRQSTRRRNSHSTGPYAGVMQSCKGHTQKSLLIVGTAMLIPHIKSTVQENSPK